MAYFSHNFSDHPTSNIDWSKRAREGVRKLNVFSVDRNCFRVRVSKSAGEPIYKAFAAPSWEMSLSQVLFYLGCYHKSFKIRHEAASILYSNRCCHIIAQLGGKKPIRQQVINNLSIYLIVVVEIIHGGSYHTPLVSPIISHFTLNC